MKTLQKTTESKIQRKREFLYGELTYKINGILFEAYKELGQFAREKQYADVIEKKLKDKAINFAREITIGNSGNVLDFLIDDKIILELKAKPFLIREHYDQIKRYLHETNLRLGILVNFRTSFLNPKRVLNPNFDN